MTSESQHRMRLADLLRELRPNQWTKNGIVLAALFFAFWDQSRPQALGLTQLFEAILAALLFCVGSSAIYVLNDIRDADADRKHPVKRNRPIAAGKVPMAVAWRITLVLLIISLGGAYWLDRSFFQVITAYVIIQLVYSLGLKHVALVDVMVISMGFVLRAIAGAVVIGVDISPWLLLCTFLLALFLGLCKRRHEKLLDEEQNTQHRAALEKYDARLLDQLIAITSGATIVSYAIYTLWPDTYAKFGTHALGFTVPFVVFGIFRYLDLVYRHDRGGRPERILLTDIPLLVDLALYGITTLLIFSLNF